MQSRLSLDSIVEVDYKTDPRWETFVNRHSAGSIFHHPLWLRILEMEYGTKPVCLVHEDADSQIAGILPLLETKGLPFRRNSRIVGRRLSSLPRTPMAGPLVLDGVSVAPLIDSALELTKAGSGCALEIKALSALSGVPECLAGVPWRMSYVLDLPERPENLHFGNSRNHARIKWAIGKALKAGVRVRPASNEWDLLNWYPLYLETMRMHVIPPRSFRFFKNCWNLLGKAGFMWLLLAELHGSGRPKVIAGSVFFMFGDTVFYAFNGRRRKALFLRPNDAIQWHAIQTACLQGFRRFDFGEVSDGNQGLAEFKSKWGARPSQLYRYYYPSPPELSGTESTNPAAAVADGLWKHLPLKFTEYLGGWLYRYM